MKAKRLLTALLATVCAVTMVCSLAACGDKDDTPKQPDVTAEKLCKGVWDTPLINDPKGRHNFVAFHADGIFYHSQYGGNLQEAGYWKLVNEEITFNLFNDYTTPQLADEAKKWEATKASSYVELTKFDGTPYTTTKDVDATDPNVATNKYALYDDGSNGLAIYGVWYSNTRYVWNENSTHTVADETAVQLCTYVLASDASQNVTINHNGAVVELEGDFDDNATWTYNSANRTYTITKEDGTATLVVAADGKSATYKSGSAAEIALIDPNNVPSGDSAFLEVTESTNVFSLGFYKNGTYKISATMGGQTQDMKSGTWSYDNYGVALDGGTAVYPNQETGWTFTISLTTSQGANDYTFVVAATNLPLFEANKPTAEEKSFLDAQDTSTTFTLSFYKGGTYKVTASFGGQTQDMKSGTWSYDNYGVALDGGSAVYPNQETGWTFTISLTTSQGANDYTFVVAATNLPKFEANKPAPIAPTSFLDAKDTSTTFTLSFYNNGTYKVTASLGGQTQDMKSGTWSYDNYGVALDGGTAVYRDGRSR